MHECMEGALNGALLQRPSLILHALLHTQHINTFEIRFEQICVELLSVLSFFKSLFIIFCMRHFQISF